MARVLIADDNAPFRKLCREAFESAGYSVVEAEDGREAVLLARNESPDAVVIDLAMPGMDGMEALERMSDFRKRPPAVIFSSYETCRNNYHFWGAQAYVHKKDMDFTELIETVDRLLDRNPVDSDS